MKKKLYAILRLLILGVAVCILVSGCKASHSVQSTEDNTNYQYAKELLQKNKYEQAIKQLIEIVEYKDSAQLLIESSTTIAHLAMEIENYQDVINVLTPVIQALEKTQINKEEIAPVRLALGKAYYEIGEFDQATILFDNIKQFADESEKYLRKIELLTPFQGDWQRAEYPFPFSYRIKGTKITYLSGVDSGFTKTLVAKENEFLYDEDDSYQYKLINGELEIKALNGATFREGHFVKIS